MKVIEEDGNNFKTINNTRIFFKHKPNICYKNYDCRRKHNMTQDNIDVYLSPITVDEFTYLLKHSRKLTLEGFIITELQKKDNGIFYNEFSTLIEVRDKMIIDCIITEDRLKRIENRFNSYQEWVYKYEKEELKGKLK
jgi:hypothetical protein